MRVSFLVAALGSIMAALFLYPAAAEGAQVFQITSLSGDIDGQAHITSYSAYNNQYSFSDYSFAQSLNPAIDIYSVASSRSGYGSYAYSSLSTTLTDTSLSFAATAAAYTGNPFAGVRVDANATYQLDIRFTVSEATQMQLTLEPFYQSSSAQYALYSFDSYTYNILSLQQISGVDQTGLYALHPDGTGRTLDTIDGTNDGVFYTTTLLPGLEYQLTLDCSTSVGDALARGSLNFTPVPVPEPSGALLLLLGVALMTPRRRVRGAA